MWTSAENGSGLSRLVELNVYQTGTEINTWWMWSCSGCSPMNQTQIHLVKIGKIKELFKMVACVYEHIMVTNYDYTRNGVLLKPFWQFFNWLRNVMCELALKKYTGGFHIMTSCSATVWIYNGAKQMVLIISYHNYDILIPMVMWLPFATVFASFLQSQGGSQQEVTQGDHVTARSARISVAKLRAMLLSDGSWIKVKAEKTSRLLICLNRFISKHSLLPKQV